MATTVQFIVTLVVLIPGEPPRISVIAGTGVAGYSGDGGPAIIAKLDGPFDVALDAAGNLFFSDTGNNCIRRIDAKTGIIMTVAGCGKKGFSGDGGSATKAELNEPYGLQLDRDGNLYFVDRLNFRVRMIEARTGNIRTVAGSGRRGFSGDGGSAIRADMREPNGLALDGKGKLYIADVADQRVRVVDLKAGVISTACGTGKKAHTGDGGPASEAALFGPRAVAVGPDGSLFICEREGNSIRRIDFKSGTIDRVAGTGKKGYTGDGGPSAKATFNGPKEIEIDANGNIFVVDTENHAIRRIGARTGIIATVAGTGKQGGTDEGGPAIKAALNRPHGVCIGRDGAIFIGDTLNNRIRRVK